MLNTYHQRLSDLHTRLKRNRNDFELRIQIVQLERSIETRIRDVFLRFMCTCFCGYQEFLRPIVRRPNASSTDASHLFDFQRFLHSRQSANFLHSRGSSSSEFFTDILHTQMFSRFIEERSFLSSSTLNQSSLLNESIHHNYSLVFFDDCCARVQVSIKSNRQKALSLLDAPNTTKNFLSEKTTLILPDFIEMNHSGTNGHGSSNSNQNATANNGNRIHSQEATSLRPPQEQPPMLSMKHVPNSPMVKRSKFERDKCQQVRCAHDDFDRTCLTATRRSICPGRSRIQSQSHAMGVLLTLQRLLVVVHASTNDDRVLHESPRDPQLRL